MEEKEQIDDKLKLAEKFVAKLKQMPDPSRSSISESPPLVKKLVEKILEEIGDQD